MLTLDHLGKQYGRSSAVAGLCLKIPHGQMVGVIGPSGAGKSTTLRMINRLTEPSAGRILYDSQDVTALSGQGLRQWRARCAMVFQHFNLVSRMDVLTNVLIGRVSHRPLLASLCKRFTREDRERAFLALERVNLADKFSLRADQLSGGQQQRVAIARALVQEPRLVLADEPIAALDPRNAVRVMETLQRMSQDDGMTVMVNLHSVEMARTYCDRIVAMAQGRVVFDGVPDALGTAQLREIYGAEHDNTDQAKGAPAVLPVSQPAVALV